MPINQALKDIQKQISRNGKLPGGVKYWEINESLFGRKKKTTSGNKIASKASALTKSETIGSQPEGFGKGFTWDRKDAKILLNLFVNAADPAGIAISGVESDDVIEFRSGSSIASFTEDKGNPFVASLIGLVASAAEIGAPLVGLPEAEPFIKLAEEFATDQFKATGAKHKRRDVFGVDPSSGHKARQEGGILITLPEANGPFYSGDGDHKERWIKKHEDRLDAIRPDHVKHAFFPVRGNSSHNRRKVGGSGTIYVTPWDHIFEDNAGFYKVEILISKSSDDPIVVD